AVLFLGGQALREPYLTAAASSGHRLLAETFPTRMGRGAWRPNGERLAYLAEFAAMQLEGITHLVLCGAKSPVSFFAYPGKASDLVPEGCEVTSIPPTALLNIDRRLDSAQGTSSPSTAASPPSCSRPPVPSVRPVTSTPRRSPPRSERCCPKA